MNRQLSCLFISLACASLLQATEPSNSPVNFLIPSAPTLRRPMDSGGQVPHKFWDNQNKFLIFGGASLRAADVITTRQMDRRGAPFDILPHAVRRTTPHLAAFSAASAAGTAGLMYLAHRTGHHRVERVLGWAEAAFLAGCVGNNIHWLHRYWSWPTIY